MISRTEGEKTMPGRESDGQDDVKEKERKQSLIKRTEGERKMAGRGKEWTRR